MTAQYLLDTNICIYIAKNKPQSVLDRFIELKVGQVFMSTITYGELLFGAEKSQHPIKTKHTIQKLSNLIPAIPIPISAAQHYAQQRQQLEKKGKPIGNNDLWIASHALANGLILVSNNLKEFKRINKLKLENWVT